ncbi:unnamed protein product, partial [Pleuronectes platessa]
SSQLTLNAINNFYQQLRQQFTERAAGASDFFSVGISEPDKHQDTVIKAFQLLPAQWEQQNHRKPNGAFSCCQTCTELRRISRPSLEGLLVTSEGEAPEIVFSGRSPRKNSARELVVIRAVDDGWEKSPGNKRPGSGCHAKKKRLTGAGLTLFYFLFLSLNQTEGLSQSPLHLLGSKLCRILTSSRSSSTFQCKTRGRGGESAAKPRATLRQSVLKRSERSLPGCRRTLTGKEQRQSTERPPQGGGEGEGGV